MRLIFYSIAYSDRPFRLPGLIPLSQSNNPTPHIFNMLSEGRTGAAFPAFSSCHEEQIEISCRNSSDSMIDSRDCF